MEVAKADFLEWQSSVRDGIARKEELKDIREKRKEDFKAEARERVNFMGFGDESKNDPRSRVLIEETLKRQNHGEIESIIEEYRVTMETVQKGDYSVAKSNFRKYKKITRQTQNRPGNDQPAEACNRLMTFYDNDFIKSDTGIDNQPISQTPQLEPSQHEPSELPTIGLSPKFQKNKLGAIFPIKKSLSEF